MSRLVARAFTVSLDGYGAGPDQSLAAPMGTGAEALHGWFIPTRTFRKMFGQDGGTTGPDDDFAAAVVRQPRRLGDGPQHVHPRARRLVGPRLARLVGRRCRPITAMSSC